MIHRYKLYTLPACEKCKDVKAFLATTSLQGEHVDLGNPEQLKEFRTVYPKIKDKLQRMDCGSLPVPIILLYDDNNEMVNLAHKVDDIKALL